MSVSGPGVRKVDLNRGLVLLLTWATMALAFVLIHRALFLLPLHGDSWTAVWMVRELSWWDTLTDPTSAGYIYVLFFEPLYVPLHAADLLLAPLLGPAAFHVVAFAALMACAALLAHLARCATKSQVVAFIAAALFLFNGGAWYALADSAYRHYPVATAFGLLSLTPSWHSFLSGEVPRRRVAWLSALAYFLAVAAKESSAGLPLLLFALVWQGSSTLRGAVAFVLPHALALAVLLAWRFWMIGGLGGYPYVAPLSTEHILLSLGAAAQALWGTHWIGVGLVILGTLLRWRMAGIWVAAGVATMAPFALTVPLDASGGGVGKLLLPIALLILLLATSIGTRRVPTTIGAAILGGILVVWQGQHHDNPATLPFAQAPAPVFSTSGVEMATPLTLLDVAWERQVRATPPREATVFASHADLELYGALEGSDPTDQPASLGIAPAPRVVPLAEDRFSVDVSARGVVRFCLAEGGQPKSIALLYRNGPTSFFISLPLNRRCLSLPAARSFKSVYLLVADGQTWQVHRWDSPFYQDPYPHEPEVYR